ncbi:MAG: CHASE3 domain-containing protein, partial [Xanthobacteraceae bacterium]
MRLTAVPRLSVQPILLGVGVARLVAIGAATVGLAEQSAADAKRVVATINVQGKLSDLLLNVRRAESGQRGYLLTGRQAYLSDYRDAAPTVETNLTELRAMMGEYSERIPVLDQVAALARAKMAELAKTVDLHDSGQIDAALATVQSDEGLKSMNALRVLAERLLRGEERVLLARSDASRSNDARLLTVTLAGLALIVLIGALSIFLVQRTFRQREAARNELAATNANLERIVAHRTADLTEANEEIQRFA